MKCLPKFAKQVNPGCQTGISFFKLAQALDSAVQVAVQPLTVTNSSAAPARVTWETSEAAVAVVPGSAVVAPGTHSTFGVHIRGLAASQLHAQAICSVQHGSQQTVDISATVNGGSPSSSGLAALQHTVHCAASAPN